LDANDRSEFPAHYGKASLRAGPIVPNVNPDRKRILSQLELKYFVQGQIIDMIVAGTCRSANPRCHEFQSLQDFFSTALKL
jgi:hypothetical protein